MALREKLIERVVPHLEPGERVQAVFLAQTGPSPYWVFLTWLTMLWNRYLIVAVTDRSIVTFRATAFKPSFVKQPVEMERLDRRHRFGPMSGLWGKVELGGRTYHVHKRFHKDLAGADAALDGGMAAGGTAATTAGAVGAAAAAAPGWYPDPNGGNGQRYWDGTRWTEHTA